ncbi:MAG: TonB-dependent receptor [Chlorobiota bacterium]|nr:TonB-dependent receptor [Chlorobiota bacterium]QQS66970.1 MAG: TonB-dependent receptor [Chlorobiota bacterium]
MKLLILSISIFFTVCSLSFSQNSNSFSGIVFDKESNKPLNGVVIEIKEFKIGSISSSDGSFIIKNIPEKSFIVRIKLIGYEEQFLQISDHSQKVNVKIYLLLKNNVTDEVVVKRKKYEDNLISSNQSKSVIDENELDKHRGENFSESLKNVAGVTLLQTGPSISKPVIRGLHSQRVLILNNDTRQEGQQWGNEHAPEIDPFSVGKIEVLKGAKGVEYGSDAIGGVIRVEARELPEEGINGKILLNGFSNNKQFSGSTFLEGANLLADGFAWRVQGSVRYAGDAQTPNYLLANTAFRESDASINLSYKFNRTSFTFLGSHFNTNIGIFSGSHISSSSDLLRAIKSDTPLVSRSFSYDILPPDQKINHNILSLEYKTSTSELGTFDAKFSYQLNQRQEFDSHKPYSDSLANLLIGKPAIDMSLYTYTIDGTLNHNAVMGGSGKIGLSFTRQSNVSDGKSQFIPNYRVYSAGSFITEEFYPSDDLILNFGARFDYRNLFVYQFENNKIVEKERIYSTLSFDVGEILKLSDNFSISSNLGSAWRAPSINELFANGVHHGTATFEIGDTNLIEERSYSIDATLRYKTEKIRGELSSYFMYFPHFIQLLPKPEPTLTIRGSFPTFYFSQNKSTLKGLEGLVEIFITDWFKIESSVTIVRGDNIDSNKFLFQMPSDKFRFSTHFHIDDMKFLKDSFLEFNMNSSFKQTRELLNEDYLPAPDGYVLFGINGGTTSNIFSKELEFNFSVDNLFNISYRDYLSRYRYFADDIGRNISFRISLAF